MGIVKSWVAVALVQTNDLRVRFGCVFMLTCAGEPVRRWDRSGALLCGLQKEARNFKTMISSEAVVLYGRLTRPFVFTQTFTDVAYKEFA